MRVVFTIHNLSYGGDLIGRAMASCEVATTVSPTYAREVGGPSKGCVGRRVGVWKMCGKFVGSKQVLQCTMHNLARSSFVGRAVMSRMKRPGLREH